MDEKLPSERIDDDVDLSTNMYMLTPVEVDMVVEDNPLVFSDDKGDDPPDPSLDPVQLALSMYSNEMLESGLTASDLDYFAKTFKILDRIRYSKMHCTSCDKHLGTSPLAKKDRYCHPLLKVLMCEDCYTFYCSGEFDTDEDGSELYCRWCGEGGQVFCCTKCPFVFCKRCITRNLGRGIASLIQNSEDWLCFVCNPCQINKHRASFWAIQKYSDLKMSQTCDEEELSKDFGSCCGKNKKRSLEKMDENMELAPKKRKMGRSSKNSKKEKAEGKEWKASTSEQQQDEVVCTPDILPLSESPVPSPASEAPSLVSPLRILSPAKVNSQVKVTVDPFFLKGTVSDHWKNMSPKEVSLHPICLAADNSDVQFVGQTVLKPILPKPVPGLSRVVSINKLPPGPSPTPPIKPKPLYVPPASNRKKMMYSDKEWLNNAVIDSKHVNEYTAAKIATITSFKRKTSEELYNMFQVYLDVAIEKLQKIKEKLEVEYNSAMPFRKSVGVIHANPKPSQQGRVEVHRLEEEASIIVSDSDDEAPAEPARLQSSPPPLLIRKPVINNAVVVVDVKPEDILFEMDVTNASDEESSDSSDYETQSARAAGSSNDDDDNLSKTEDAVAETHPETCESQTVVPEPTPVDEVKARAAEVEVRVDEEKGDDGRALSPPAEQPSEANDDKTKDHELVVLPDPGVKVKDLKPQDLQRYLSAKVMMEKTNLDKVMMGKTNLDKVMMEKTNLDKIMMEKTNLDKAMMGKTNLDKAMMEKTNLDKAMMEKTNLDKVCLRRDNSNSVHRDQPQPDEAPSGCDRDEVNKDECLYNGDFEEILAGNIVMRSQTVVSTTSFEDVFSKFINNSSVSSKGYEPEPVDPVSVTVESDESENFEIPAEDIDDSLSLPPHSIMEISSQQVTILKKLKTPKVVDGLDRDGSNEGRGQVSNNNENANLENELVALRHLAENCVPSTLTLKSAAAEVKSCEG